ncbi:hypothetical protein [Streptomyces sp. NPDC053720]|uniref:hypothetical protein n=1 Tax=Streptomyces sp. NPDC053720 TaxID=3154855 RepID=UPI003432AFC8
MTTHRADFRFAHPGPVDTWAPDTFDGYLDAQLADQAAAERTLARRALRGALAVVEYVLAGFAALAVLIMAGSLKVADGADWAAEGLCAGTDRITVRLARLGRRRSNLLLASMYDPDDPGAGIFPHEDPGEDSVEKWIGHWETEVERCDEAEAKLADTEAKLAAAQQALTLLYTAANLGAGRARQREQFMTGTVRSGKSFPNPLGLSLCQACGHPAHDDDPLVVTADRDRYTIHLSHTEDPEDGFYMWGYTLPAGTPAVGSTTRKEITQ